MSWSDLTFGEFEKIADCLGNRYMEFMDNAACDEASDADSYGTPEREGEMAIRELLKRLEKMRAERDEARRLYCDHVILHGTAHLINGNKGLDEITDAQSLARHLGWDCFSD